MPIVFLVKQRETTMRIALCLFLTAIACGHDDSKPAPAPAPYSGPKVVKGSTKGAVKAIMGDPTDNGIGIGDGATSWAWTSPTLCSPEAWRCSINFNSEGLVDRSTYILPNYLDSSTF